SASCFPDPAPGRDGGRRGWDVPQTRRAGAVGAIASAPVRCPTCSSLEDRVVDSRLADDGTAIRRRRECATCGRRFTTFERIEEVGLVVAKRDGSSEPFDREKLAAGIRKAFAGRPTSPLQIEQMVGRIETRVRRKGPDVTSQQVG